MKQAAQVPVIPPPPPPPPPPVKPVEPIPTPLAVSLLVTRMYLHNTVQYIQPILK